MRFHRLLVVALVLLIPFPAFGRISRIKDSRSAVFESELVVIVSHDEGDTYKIEEVFLQTGEAQDALAVGNTVSVPGFSLFSDAPDFNARGVIRHEMTDDTRILLFLKRVQDKPGEWEVAGHGYCFFWVNAPSKIDTLRREATAAVSLRTEWEKAAAIEDPKARVAALWPFLWKDSWKCSLMTREELVKTGEVAGDFVAERFPFLSHSERMKLLSHFGRFGGDKLHSVLVSHLKNLQGWYPAYAPEPGPDGRLPENEWAALSANGREIWSELYYGTTGLAYFKDETDLPFIRELGLWAAKHRVKQTCDAALNAFRNMPAKDNLPVIEAIWEEFTECPYKGNELNPFDVARTLRAHKYVQTVPVLVKLLDDPKAATEARSFLAEIVGEDLGPDPLPWLDWYAEHVASTRTDDSPD